MRNSKIEISEEWNIVRDVFYDLDPADDSIFTDEKYDNMYCQEDLFLISFGEFNLDLGWYGGENNGFFGVHLFRGDNWHNCHLMEKRTIKDYHFLIETLNKLIKNVEIGLYNSIRLKLGAIDDFIDSKNVVTFE